MDFVDLKLREALGEQKESKPCPGTWISWIWNFGSAPRAVGEKTVSWDMNFLNFKLREAVGEQ